MTRGNEVDEAQAVGVALWRLGSSVVWAAAREWYRSELPPCLATDEEYEQTERALLLRLREALEQAPRNTP